MELVNKRWRELAEIKAELAARDWFPATSGNLSIKVEDEPLTFLVTASGKDKRKQTADDFLLVDQMGRPLHKTNLRASAETVIHSKIYQLTDAGCCLHIHTVDNNVISELYAHQGFITFRRQEIIKALGIWEEDGEIKVPIVENYANLDFLAQAISNVIDRDSKAVLIRGHGITVWGKTGFEAKKHLEALEFLCSYHLKLKFVLQFYNRSYQFKRGKENGTVAFP
jgi:methylthioribulose-1-phosphate dehydratase